jgi:hypothetical protein
MLEGWLEYYRASLVRKCAGLTAEQLAVRSCAPSPLSLAGLVRHMTEIERAYVHRLADPGLEARYCTDGNPDADFEDAASATALEDLRTFGDHCARAADPGRPRA